MSLQIGEANKKAELSLQVIARLKQNNSFDKVETMACQALSFNPDLTLKLRLLLELGVAHERQGMPLRAARVYDYAKTQCVKTGLITPFLVSLHEALDSLAQEIPYFNIFTLSCSSQFTKIREIYDQGIEDTALSGDAKAAFAEVCARATYWNTKNGVLKNLETVIEI